MAKITIYKAIPLSEEYHKIFSGVYNSFREASMTDYKFELEPLIFEEFIECVQSHILECLILLEDNIPTGFLVYTSAVNTAIELNIIYCLGNEDITAKRKILMEKFLTDVNGHIGSKIISYPLIGKQADFVKNITKYNFKLLGQAVVKILTNNENHSIDILNKAKVNELPYDYSITEYKEEYSQDVVKIIHEAFQNASDAQTDNRYKTLTGSKDILEKITNHVYGDFLSYASSILLHNGVPVGLCFANLTSDSIANIPLVGISKEHQGKGLSEILLKSTLCKILEQVNNNDLLIQEINATMDTNNTAAVKMYRKLGFKEDYNYIHAYLPANS